MSDEAKEQPKPPVPPQREVQIGFSFRMWDEQGVIVEFEDQAKIPGSFVAPRIMTMPAWVAGHNQAALEQFHRVIEEETMRRAEEYRERQENGTWPEDGPDAPPWDLPVGEWTQAQFDRADEECALSELSRRPEELLAMIRGEKVAGATDFHSMLIRSLPPLAGQE